MALENEETRDDLACFPGEFLPGDTSGGKKEAILQAALVVMTEKGFHDATIDEIAVKAGVGKGTIYSYFPSKTALVEDLIKTIAEFHMRNVMQSVIGNAPGAPDGKTQLLRLIEHELLFIKHHTSIARHLVSPDRFGLSPQFQIRFVDAQKKYHDLIKGMIEKGIVDGIFNADIDPQLAASMIMGLRIQLLRDWVDHGMTVPLETLKEHIVSFIFHGLTPVEQTTRATS